MKKKVVYRSACIAMQRSLADTENGRRCLLNGKRARIEVCCGLKSLEQSWS